MSNNKLDSRERLDIKQKEKICDKHRMDPKMSQKHARFMGSGTV